MDGNTISEMSPSELSLVNGQETTATTTTAPVNSQCSIATTTATASSSGTIAAHNITVSSTIDADHVHTDNTASRPAETGPGSPGKNARAPKPSRFEKVQLSDGTIYHRLKSNAQPAPELMSSDDIDDSSGVSPAQPEAASSNGESEVITEPHEAMDQGEGALDALEPESVVTSQKEACTIESASIGLNPSDGKVKVPKHLSDWLNTVRVRQIAMKNSGTLGRTKRNGSLPTAVDEQRSRSSSKRRAESDSDDNEKSHTKAARNSNSRPAKNAVSSVPSPTQNTQSKAQQAAIATQLAELARRRASLNVSRREQVAVTDTNADTLTAATPAATAAATPITVVEPAVVVESVALDKAKKLKPNNKKKKTAVKAVTLPIARKPVTRADTKAIKKKTVAVLAKKKGLKTANYYGPLVATKESTAATEPDEAEAIADENSSQPTQIATTISTTNTVVTAAAPVAVSAAKSTAKNPPKGKRPPPITVPHVNHNDLQQILAKSGAFFELKLAHNAVKVHTVNPAGHKAVSDALDAVDIEYFTHALKAGPRTRTVLKGMPDTVTAELIKHKLEENGLQPIAARQIPTMNNKLIYAVDFPLNSVTVEDLNASHSRFCGYIGKWALALPRKTSTSMCRRCCTYGHLENGCKLNYVCYACGEGHSPSSCQRINDAAQGLPPPGRSGDVDPQWRWTCINCVNQSTRKRVLDSNHMAIDPQCPVRLAHDECDKQQAATRLEVRNNKIAEAKQKAYQSSLKQQTSWPDLPLAWAKRAPAQNQTTQSPSGTLTAPAANVSRSRKVQRAALADGIRRAQSSSKARGTTPRKASSAPSGLLDPATVLDIVIQFINRLEGCTTVFEQLRVITELLRAALDQTNPSSSR